VSALESQRHTASPADADALESVAIEHVLERLKEAAQLAQQDLLENLQRFRELLAQAADQADAWVVSRTVNRETESDRPASQVEYSMLSRPGGEPLGEFLLIPFGEVRVERAVAGAGFVFEARHAESAKRWFEQMGRKLAIDYEHQSFDRYNTRPDGLRPAAGWIGRLEVRDDGLWACDVTWTDRAKELLRSGEYRYFSPVIYWADEDYSDVAALGPVALTNDPAMRGVRPLAASRRGPDELSAVEDDTGETDPGAVLQAEIAALNDEIELLRKQLAAQEADAFVERGMRLGKIVDSTSMDWREDYLRDPERTQVRLERAPVLLPPGRVIKIGVRGEVLQRDNIQSGLKRETEMPGAAGVEAEDLAAYDRALAAGRIRRFATPPQT
jgi:hypothetical protein